MTTAKLSTHVLDLQRGQPARQLGVSVYSLEPYAYLGNATTDDDGRVKEWSPPLDLLPGNYQICFDTGGWFADKGEQTLYPLVQIAFVVATGQRHYHIPLLLSPFGYSTYRGS